MTDIPTSDPDAAASADGVTTGDDVPTLTRRRAAHLFGDDAGAATAEYAIATMATVVENARITRRHQCQVRDVYLRGVVLLTIAETPMRTGRHLGTIP